MEEKAQGEKEEKYGEGEGEEEEESDGDAAEDTEDGEGTVSHTRLPPTTSNYQQVTL